MHWRLASPFGVVRWFEANVRQRDLNGDGPGFLLRDEVHQLPRRNEEVKHLAETTRARMVVTGSSGVLVAKVTRESLAGRVVTTEFPPFSLREVEEDGWADHLIETMFDRVLGVDIPDLLPIQRPQLLRHLYLSVARQTGQEVRQLELAGEVSAAGLRTNQPTSGATTTTWRTPF